MKILFLLLLTPLLLIVCSIYYFNEKRANVFYEDYYPFTIKMETTSNKRFNQNFKIVTEKYITYSVWYKGKMVTFPGKLEENTGYSHIWRVYKLAGAPTPTLIAGSQSLFLIREENDKAMVTSLDPQSSDFAGLQFLDSFKGQPGKVIPVYMNNAGKAEKIEILEGGDYLLINNRLILHIPDLTTELSIEQNQYVDTYIFLSTGGAQGFSPDKKKLVFMGSRINNFSRYEYAMIIYDISTKAAVALPYDRTLTRSRDLNYENREWFQTYFEWVKNEEDAYDLKLRNFDVRPYWHGVYVDFDQVYELAPVKSEMQQVFLAFILKRLDLTQENIQPKGEFYDNNMVINYNGCKLNLWMRAEDSILVLMMEDAYLNESNGKLQVIHQLGDAFNKELSEGQHQEYFTQF